jgi:hypothetical protein
MGHTRVKFPLCSPYTEGNLLRADEFRMMFRGRIVDKIALCETFASTFRRPT